MKVAGIAAIVCAIAYTLLGLAVAQRPPSTFDASARGMVGEAPRIAWMFTASCLWPVLTGYGVVGVMCAIVSRTWRGRIIFALVVMLVSWQTSDALKDVFGRPRPAYWIVHHETTYAYSSGHAMFATVVYWLWAYQCARGSLPKYLRIPLSGTLAAWGAGVIWSRLALGAHYPTDLIGGVLLGTGMICLGIVVAQRVAPRERVI